MLLTIIGYGVPCVLPRGEEVIVHVEQNQPDVILLDVNLKGNMDGIDTATSIQQKNVPIWKPIETTVAFLPTKKVFIYLLRLKQFKKGLPYLFCCVSIISTLPISHK